MNDMTLEEVCAAIEADPDKLAFLEKIASMTSEETNRFVSLLKFGWARIQAGEDVNAVIAEWKEAQA